MAATIVDRTAVRFYSPETGGVAYPRFISERVLAFEARLGAMGESSEGVGDHFDDRDVREAIDHHVAEEILASLAERLIALGPLDKRPSRVDVEGVVATFSAAMLDRLGGRARVDRAAAAERIERQEVDAVLQRCALAAWYVDRAIAAVLHPSEEQLRSVFRASAHPYRGHPFEEVRASLEDWFVVERVRAAESAFLESARPRVRIIATR